VKNSLSLFVVKLFRPAYRIVAGKVNLSIGDNISFDPSGFERRQVSLDEG